MARRKRGRAINGIIVLDKPLGESSNRSLQNVKRLLDASKAGHTGSLDPLATGVLPLCFGEATKISQFLLESDKTYLTTIKFGVKTASGDSEGDIVSTASTDNLNINNLNQALTHFRGEIDQIPSMFSALKQNGVPLYKLARMGKTVERKSRKVTVYDLQLLTFVHTDECCQVDLLIKCSKGTYIRSIADDLGDLLKVGAHVTKLKRTQAGPFSLEQSVDFEALQALITDQDYTQVDKLLIPADQAIINLPQVILPSTTAAYIKQGQAVIAKHLPLDGLVRLYEGELFIGIGEILDDGRVTPKKLFHP